MALFITRLNARIFRPGLAALEPIETARVPHPLREALDDVNLHIDNLIERSCLKCA
jgi:hypothetical protein